jgi:chromosome segregation ATPase
MAKKEINIVLRAKNAMQAELSKAGESLKKFGDSAMRIGKLFAGAFLAAGTAVAGFAVKAIRSMKDQEEATTALRSAFRAFGDNVDENVAMVQKFSNAMQRQVGISNEALEMRAAELRQLGVLPQHLEAAVKATVALGRAGMSEAAATRAVAAAREGDFSQLTRYIPQLRTATDEAEKAAIVNDFLSRKYREAEDQTATLAGKYAVMKEEMADAWKEAGQAIAQSEILQKVMDKVTAAVQRLSERIAAWVDSGGVVNMMAAFSHFFNNIRHGFNQTSNAAHIAFSAIADGSETAVKFLIEGFRTIGRVAVAVFEAMRRPSREAFANINAQARTMVDNVEIVTRRTDAALQQRQQNEIDHLNRSDKINERHIQRLQEMQQDRVDDHAEAIEQIEVAEVNLAKKIEELEKKKADARKKTADLEKRLADEKKRLEERALQDRLADLKKEQQANRQVANMRVQDIIDAAKRERDIEREKAREARRAQELEERIARGINISRRQQEFLDAFRKIEAAGAQGDPIQNQIDLAQQQLDALRDDGQKLDDIKNELERTRKVQEGLAKDLQGLLRAK